MSGHFGQDIGPEGWLLRSSPAEGWRVPGCVLQLHATRQNISAREPLLCERSTSRQLFPLVPAARAGRVVMHTAAARATPNQVRLSDGRNYFRNNGSLFPAMLMRKTQCSFRENQQTNIGSHRATLLAYLTNIYRASTDDFCLKSILVYCSISTWIGL